MPALDIEAQPVKGRSILARILPIVGATLLVATVFAVAGPHQTGSSPHSSEDVSKPESVAQIKLAAHPDGDTARDRWLQQLPEQTAACGSNPFFAEVCHTLPRSCQKDQVDVHGNFPAASATEDRLARKIYNKWISSTGQDRMVCPDLRKLGALYSTAVVGERELSADGVALAKGDGEWPSLCENATDTVDCRKILATAEDIDVMDDGLRMLGRFVATAIHRHQEVLAKASKGRCDLLFSAFINHAVSFKTNLQEPVLCRADDPNCETQVQKKNAIYDMKMYANFRKGRAKTDSQKEAARQVLGPLDSFKIDHTAGIEQDSPTPVSDSVCTLSWEKGFFDGFSNSSKDFFHGKFTTQRCIDPSKSNPANLFQKANAPFICGLSGSILEIMRFNDAFAGRYISTTGKPGIIAANRVRAVDDRFGLLLMAMLDLGGHHSLTESGVAVKEWGLLSDVDPPFFADDSLVDMSDDEVAQLPRRYQNYLVTLEKKIDWTDFASK